jgi:hypothetical protein
MNKEQSALFRFLLGPTMLGLLFAFCILVLPSLTMANIYFTRSGVLKAIQAENPGATEVLETYRNLVDYSIIIVKENGRHQAYLLDTNMLFSYTLHKFSPSDNLRFHRYKGRGILAQARHHGGLFSFYTERRSSPPPPFLAILPFFISYILSGFMYLKSAA